MKGHECYHCKQWVAEGEAHDCWTTTEAALTRELSEDLQDAYARLREAAAELGEQRIYASHKSIMFSRKSCYVFVRPRKTHLEVCVFLGRPIKAPQVRRVERPSKAKVANLLRVTHRDEVEAPITDWLREAYDFASVSPGLKTRPTSARPTSAKVQPASTQPASTKTRSADVGRVSRPGKGKPPKKRTAGTRRSTRAGTPRGRR